MIAAEKILAQVDALPPLPATSVRVMSLIDDPRSSMNDIVDAIKYDQAVTGRILRLCNSAAFGATREITSLQQATVRLGATKVLQLVLAVHADSVLGAEQTGYELEAGALWRHAAATAQGAVHFARLMRIENAGLAFTAGLLHDIGKVVLSRYVAEEFAEILALVTREGRAFVEAEREVLGFDHTQIGEMVAERWKLPEPLVRCIRYHHEPGVLEPSDPLVDAVYLANCLCLLLGIGLGADGLCYRADGNVLARYGLSERDLEVVSIEILSELQKLVELFAPETRTTPVSA